MDAPALPGSAAAPAGRPITLTPACVRAILAGRKSQLRAVARVPEGADAGPPACPLGGTGDLLWVREDTMPRGASRLALLIRTTRLERLQSIRDEDLLGEGGMWRETAPPGEGGRAGFARWWNDVHARAEALWEADPWVWVVEFEVVPCT